jgi:hypothetical protein
MTEYERCVVTVYERYARASYHCRSVRACRLQRASSHGRRGVARPTSWFADRALKARIGALTEKQGHGGRTFGSRPLALETRMRRRR